MGSSDDKLVAGLEREETRPGQGAELCGGERVVADCSSDAKEELVAAELEARA